MQTRETRLTQVKTHDPLEPLSLRVYKLRKFIEMALAIKEDKNKKFRRWVEKHPEIEDDMKVFSYYFLKNLKNKYADFFLVVLNPNLKVSHIKSFLKKVPVAANWLTRNIDIVEDLNEKWKAYSIYSHAPKIQSLAKFRKAITKNPKTNSSQFFKPNQTSHSEINKPRELSVEDILPDLYYFVINIKETKWQTEKMMLERFLEDSIVNVNSAQEIIEAINKYRQKIDNSIPKLANDLDHFLNQLALSQSLKTSNKNTYGINTI